jgi:hypothetical protein
MAPKVKLATAQAPKSLNLPDLVLVGDRGVRANLRAATTEAVHEQTIEGASTVTITVRDPERGLLRSNLVKTKSRLTLDRVQYLLVKVERDGGRVTLTFEETAVNVLRDYDKPRKANRANTTRAQFVQTLVREPKTHAIPFRCPELKVKQAIAR